MRGKDYTTTQHVYASIGDLDFEIRVKNVVMVVVLGPPESSD